MDIAKLRNGVRRVALDLGADQNEMEQLEVYLEAFGVFVERELKYHSLWKQYGAVDSYHHVTSKAARSQFYLEGTEDESDPLDLINYTAFLIRNMRANRIHNSAKQSRAIELTDRERNLIRSALARWTNEGVADLLEKLEGGERGEVVSTTEETTPIRNWQGEIPEGEWCCYSCDYHTTLLDSAARHAEKNDDWVWLFPRDKSANTEALFEMHSSDSAEGVYLSQSQTALTWNKFYRHREQR